MELESGVLRNLHSPKEPGAPRLRRVLWVNRIFVMAQHAILAESWRRRLFAFFGGAVGALALPPVGFFPAFFVPMTLSVWLLDGSTGSSLWLSLRRAASAGWWLGFGYFIAGLWWLGAAFLAEADRFAWALPLGVLGLPAVLAIFTAFGFVFARLLWSAGAVRIFALSAGLAAAEWARGCVLTGFPWNDFGMVLGGNLVLAQTASIWGLYGLTILSILIFSSLSLLIDPGHKILPVGAMILLAALGLLGIYRLSSSFGAIGGTRVRIVQPNVALDDFRADHRDQLLDQYLALSDRSTSPETNGIGDITHIFWPESSFPFILARDHAALSLLGSRLQKAILFTGAARADGEGRNAQYFNAIQVIFGGEVKESYDKIHLVPFGEYLPLSGLFAKLGLTQFVEIPGGFRPGLSSKLLNAPGMPPALPLVCYESIFPSDVAERVNAQPSRPGFLLNVTNDGWFGATPGPYQHFAQVRLRTIEQGLPMIRAANTGISAILDPFGRTIAVAPLGVEAVIDGTLPKALSPTLFSQFPKAIPLIFWLFILAASFIRRRPI